MNWRKALLTAVLATGLVASFAPSADARCRCDDDAYYDGRYDDSYDRYDPYDRSGGYDDRYYDRSGGGYYQDAYDYDGDGRFKFKRDWPALLGLFMNTQGGGQLGQLGQLGQFGQFGR